ncbi:putative immunity protein [Clavibacter capsici]|uniref:Imm-5-like domain-containing protein n=1 Tax=Clavibacter capsici TaxID=1874630 RepID=A0AAE7CD77_9MICO|nr:hypothetical protein [Clavibacter capsici]ALD13768.1 hypothetical protein AES38_13355 [Clavibacter capsici]QIS46001.1 hypothetical protein GW570_13350 [Clavibacter capsici]
MPILPKDRDPALITVRRGGALTDDDHRALALWAVACAEHVLPLFEAERPDDPILRETFEVARGWVRGDVPMKEAHQQSFRANAAGRGSPDPARFSALAAGQAVAVAHVAAHDLGAAAYAIRAASAAAPPAERDAARDAERAWQRERIPARLRAAVLADQRARSSICWGVFDDLA